MDDDFQLYLTGIANRSLQRRSHQLWRDVIAVTCHRFWELEQQGRITRSENDQYVLNCTNTETGEVTELPLEQTFNRHANWYFLDLLRRERTRLQNLNEMRQDPHCQLVTNERVDETVTSHHADAFDDMISVGYQSIGNTRERHVWILLTTDPKISRSSIQRRLKITDSQTACRIRQSVITRLEEHYDLTQNEQCENPSKYEPQTDRKINQTYTQFIDEEQSPEFVSLWLLSSAQYYTDSPLSTHSMAARLSLTCQQVEEMLTRQNRHLSDLFEGDVQHG